MVQRRLTVGGLMDSVAVAVARPGFNFLNESVGSGDEGRWSQPLFFHFNILYVCHFQQDFDPPGAQSLVFVQFLIGICM